jgi:HEXXH motif-containing protein
MKRLQFMRHSLSSTSQVTVADLLDFRLPPFMRLSWASQAAGVRWAERLETMRFLQSRLDVSSVVMGLRPAAMVEGLDPTAIQVPEAWQVNVLAPEALPELPGPPVTSPLVLVGKADTLADLKRAWSERDIVTMGTLLGYPACCIDHFMATFQLPQLWDAVWAWHPRPTAEPPRPASGIHPLLAKLGISRTPHVPCSPECVKSHHIAEAWERLGQEMGWGDILTHRTVLLDSAVHWSARHGIAELKTPLFRLTTDVAATLGTYQLALEGDVQPEDAATGGVFPYLSPRKRAVTGQVSWQLGLDHQLETPTPAAFHFRRVDRSALPAIDWTRVAIPQADGYDTEIIRQCAAIRFSRTGRWEDLARHDDNAPTMLEGDTQLRLVHHPHPLGDSFDHAPLFHPSYDCCTALLARWPDAYRQLQTLVHTLHPAIQRDVTDDTQVIGSCSHAFETEFGTFYATIHDPYALAQAFVHEMAHMKLFALGFGKESTGKLIQNPLHEQYHSTIRTDQPRPMSAVIHAQYAFIHVVALDLHMLAAETDPAARNHLHVLLARNVPRMEVGYRTIADHVTLTSAGEAFMGAFMSWSRQVLDQGRALLDA